MGADKVLRMPRPTKSRHHLKTPQQDKTIQIQLIQWSKVNWIEGEMKKKSDLPDNGLLAGRATSFGGGGDTLFVHVSLFESIVKCKNGINDKDN